MPMRVVLVRHMRMRVMQRLMSMDMAVRACRHRCVAMRVVAVVVNVGMFVFQRLVHMPVPMTLGQVQHDPGHHQRNPGQHPDAAAALPQGKCKCSPDEGCERENRPRARGAKGALRKQIEAQAQPVAGCADQEQRRSRPERRQGFLEHETIAWKRG